MHFNELDPELRALFNGSRQGLVSYCDDLMKDGDLVLQIWRAVNGINPTRDYKVQAHSI